MSERNMFSEVEICLFQTTHAPVKQPSQKEVHLCAKEFLKVTCVEEIPEFSFSSKTSVEKKGFLGKTRIPLE